jgi:AraC-like DNA-binding protein
MQIDPRDHHLVEVDRVVINGKTTVSSGVKSGHYVYFLKRGTLGLTSQSGSQHLRPRQIGWIGAGVERNIRSSGSAEWIILRIRNRLFAPGNGADRIAWRTLMKVGHLSRTHPRLLVSAMLARRLFALAESLLEVASGTGPASLPQLKGHVLQCLGLVEADPQFRKASRDCPDTIVKLDRLQRVLVLIEEEAAAIADASALAQRCGLSRSGLYRLFSESSLPAPAVFLERARLDLATRLLRESDLAILHIAMETGFGSLSAFYRAFERAYGQPPGRFRA